MEQIFQDVESSAAMVIAGTADLVVSYAFSVVGAIILLVAGFIVAGWAKRAVFHALDKRGDTTLARFMAAGARYGVLILVGVTVLAQFGVQTASIIAALGAAGLAIGLALQGTLQNVAAGVMLLFLRPFKIGDFINAGSVMGSVEEIGLFATELKTFDGLYVLAPNSSVWGSPVTNYSRVERRRFDLTIGIGYDDDVDLALETLGELVRGDDRVLDDPEPFLFVGALGDSAVEVTARVWIGASDWWTASRELTKKAKQEFDARGISIPFPQRDVHMITAGQN